MASREYKRIMEKAVTVHSRNAHKPRIYDPIQYTFKEPMYSNGALASVFTKDTAMPQANWNGQIIKS